MKNYNKLLNTVLLDDETEKGGVAFIGETLGDFMIQANLPLSLVSCEPEKLNKRLVECGIQPVDIILEDDDTIYKIVEADVINIMKDLGMDTNDQFLVNDVLEYFDNHTLDFYDDYNQIVTILQDSYM